PGVSYAEVPGDLEDVYKSMTKGRWGVGASPTHSWKNRGRGAHATKMNPVLQKDLLGLLRLKRVAAVQVLFVAVLAVMVLGSWPQGGVAEGSASVGGAGVVRSADRFLLALTLGQIVLLVLFVPGVASVAVSG